MIPYLKVMEGSSCKCQTASDCKEERCCERGACLAVIPSFVNHSCFPNVRKCFTNDINLIMYSIRPIAKNAQVSKQD